MSKKDFIYLADCLREFRGLDLVRLEDVLDVLVGFCRSQNPRFDEDRWRDYLAGKCGPSGGKVKRTSLMSR